MRIRFRSFLNRIMQHPSFRNSHSYLASLHLNSGNLSEYADSSLSLKRFQRGIRRNLLIWVAGWLHISNFAYAVNRVSWARRQSAAIVICRRSSPLSSHCKPARPSGAGQSADAGDCLTARPWLIPIFFFIGLVRNLTESTEINVKPKNKVKSKFYCTISWCWCLLYYI